ncbi:cytochrome P450 704C1-like [Phalaenopsis equestris]|uniref:cytochrome P450 704C1-like n=1 Tax=Phalaenopsis equestris TaxID=78828 RepID=UPI0009E23B8B|nr:cytochrome P450 704C1-like [Phalaenopsis equestris]
MASPHISELFTYLTFSTFYLLSTALALVFLYVFGSFLSFIIFYLQESIHSSHRPPVAGTVFHQLLNFSNLFDYLTNLSIKHKTFRLVKPSHSDIYTTDPANIEYFLKTNFSNYNKGRVNYDIMKDLFGDGIFAVDGEKWKHQRKLASYEFSTKVLRDFSTAVFRTKAAKLAKKIAEVAGSATGVDMQDLLMKSTMDSIFKVGFGVELETLSGTDDLGAAFSKAFDESNYMVFRRYVDIFWRAKRNFNIGLEGQLKKNLKVIDEFVFQLIQHKREQMESNVKDKMKEDILSRFVLASQKDTTMNDKYLRDIILNFLIAGKDTSANTLSWFFYMLCKNPLVQEKIVAEIKEVIEFENGGSIDGFVNRLTEEVLDRMQYLHAALAETLRLFPAVPVDGKLAEEDDELPDGFKVKKGDGVTYISYAMGRMTYLWGEDAEDFRPERWLKNGTFQPESSFKFVSFNAGPRICLGKDFAYRQMKILAATLLHFFKFKLKNESMIARYKTMFTLHMDKGLPVIPLPRFC